MQGSGLRPLETMFEELRLEILSGPTGKTINLDTQKFRVIDHSNANAKQFADLVTHYSSTEAQV